MKRPGGEESAARKGHALPRGRMIYQDMEAILNGNLKMFRRLRAARSAAFSLRQRQAPEGAAQGCPPHLSKALAPTHFLELFSGKGGISVCIEKKGIGAVRVELSEGIECRHSAVVRVLLWWIRSGLVYAVWLGTPCSSLSRARRNIDGHGSRTAKFIYGIPRLPEAELKVSPTATKP